MSTWRAKARAVIARAKTSYTGHPDGLEAHIRAAYPFGERTNYPYKVWCEEVRAALTPSVPGEARLQLRLAAWNAGEPIREAKP